LWGLESELRERGICVLRGERHTRWDLEIRAGSFGAARLLMGVEEHPGAQQLVRIRWWPAVPVVGLGLALTCALLAVVAISDHAFIAAATLGLGALLSGGLTVLECAAATATIREFVGRLQRDEG
jgi:hypothetical protein